MGSLFNTGRTAELGEADEASIERLAAERGVSVVEGGFSAQGARLSRVRPVRRQQSASESASSRVSSASGATLVSASQRSRLSTRRLASPAGAQRRA